MEWNVSQHCTGQAKGMFCFHLISVGGFYVVCDRILRSLNETFEVNYSTLNLSDVQEIEGA